MPHYPSGERGRLMRLLGVETEEELDRLLREPEDQQALSRMEPPEDFYRQLEQEDEEINAEFEQQQILARRKQEHRKRDLERLHRRATAHAFIGIFVFGVGFRAWSIGQRELVGGSIAVAGLLWVTFAGVLFSRHEIEAKVLLNGQHRSQEDKNG